MNYQIREEVDFLVQQALTCGLKTRVSIDDDEKTVWVRSIARFNSVTGRAASFLSDLRDVASEYGYQVAASVLNKEPRLAHYYQDIGFDIETDDRGRLLIRG